VGATTKNTVAATQISVGGTPNGTYVLEAYGADGANLVASRNSGANNSSIRLQANDAATYLTSAGSGNVNFENSVGTYMRVANNSLNINTFGNFAVGGALSATGNAAIGGAGQANRNINLDVTAIGTNDSANLSAMAKGTGYATLTLGKQGRSAGWDINYNYPSTDVLGFFNIGTGTNIATLSSTGLAVTGLITASSATGSNQLKLQGSGQNGMKFATSTGAAGLIVGRSFSSDDANDFFIYNEASSSLMMRINASGNVGIGTASPGALLQIGSGTGGGNVPSTSKLMFGANNSVITFLSANDTASVDGVIGSWNTVYNHQNAKIVFDKNTANTGQILFYTQNGSGITERARIDSLGNVGIGVTPATWYSADGYTRALQISTTATLIGNNNATYLTQNSYFNAAGTTTYLTTNYATSYRQNSGEHVWQTAAAGNAGNAIFFTQAMTLDASGNLLVGTTSVGGNVKGIHTSNSSSTQWPLFTQAVDRGLIVGMSATDGIAAYFMTSSTTPVGSINCTSTATTYVSISDYRRKSNVQDLTGSGTFIDSLKPRMFDWDTGNKGVGFIAHEFAEVSPSSVSGEKDAVDADGKPIYQAMQAGTAEVIANLVAEIQQLRKRVAGLESK
jgi:hypothetical protein